MNYAVRDDFAMWIAGPRTVAISGGVFDSVGVAI